MLLLCSYFATGGVEAIVGLWELQDFTCIRTFSDLDEEVRGLSFSYDGELLAIGTANNVVIVHVDSGDMVHTIKSVPDGVTKICWHPSKYLLAYSRSLHVCKLRPGNERCSVCNGETSRYNRNEPSVGVFGLSL